MDKHHGRSGTYQVDKSTGERVPLTPDTEGNVRAGDQVLHRPQTAPHKDGDAPRDAKGERLDRDPAHLAAAKPQPAFPEPAATPPWAGPEEKKTARPEAEADTSAPRSRGVTK